MNIGIWVILVVVSYILGYLCGRKVHQIYAYYQGRADTLDKWSDVLLDWHHVQDIPDPRINDPDIFYVKNHPHMRS